MNPWRRPDRPLVIAHRGHSIEVPENTLRAYERAIELGCEAIEADVHLTRDGQLVMLHDHTLDRTTGGHGRVIHRTWSEVRELDAGSWLDPRFASLRVPTTVEFLDLAAEAGVVVCLEVKGADKDEAMAVADALVRLVTTRPEADRIFLSSYDHEALAHARRLAPSLLLAPERLPDDQPADPPETVRQTEALGAPVIQHQWHLLTQDLLRAVHNADLALWSWTTNSEASIRLSMELGADAVMGDDVATMVRIVGGESSQPDPSATVYEPPAHQPH